MGKPKQILRKSINLGEPGSQARILAEMYIQKHGNRGFSDLMRRLIVMGLSNNPEYKEWKKKALIYERKEIRNQFPELSKQLCENAEKLEQLGVEMKEFEV